MKNRQTGFSLFELMVVASILAIFASLLLNRLHYYQEVVEKTNMEVTVKALQSGLRLEMTRALMAGEKIDYPRLEHENPMDWLDRKPPNYLGEYRQNAHAFSRGAWYFDPANHELIYLPLLDEYFVPDSEGQIRIRFRVELLPKGDTQEIATARLKEVEKYTWF